MPPKKKVERAATENISLGPQVREGEWSEHFSRSFPNGLPIKTTTLLYMNSANDLALQVNLSSVLRKSHSLLHRLMHTALLFYTYYRVTQISIEPRLPRKTLTSNRPDESSPPSMTPSFTSPISREYRHQTVAGDMGQRLTFWVIPVAVRQSPE